MALLESWKCWRAQPVRVAQLPGDFLPHPQPQGHREGLEALRVPHPLLTVLLPRPGSEFLTFWVSAAS